MIMLDMENNGYDNLFGICLGGEGCIERREARQENIEQEAKSEDTTESSDGTAAAKTSSTIDRILDVLGTSSPTQEAQGSGINVNEILYAKSQENAAKQSTQRMIIIGIVIMLIVVMIISAYILTKD